jgi:hypothetical protein
MYLDPTSPSLGGGILCVREIDPLAEDVDVWPTVDLDISKTMSGHDKKARPQRVPGKSPIAAPPRVALSGRSKTEPLDDGASVKSAPDGNGSEADEAELGAKDKRIAELEKKLATMVAESEREVAQLRKKQLEVSETADFWQQKHSTLNQTFLKTDTDLRLLRQEASSFHQGREDRERDIKTRISTLLLDREAFREAYNEAMGELSAKDDTIKALQSQIWGLKNFVSASSKMDEQVTDEVFGDQMQRLGNSLQNWVITNFRRAKIGMSCFSIPNNLQDYWWRSLNLSGYRWTTNTSWSPDFYG